MSFIEALGYARQLDDPQAFLKRTDAEKWKTMLIYLETKASEQNKQKNIDESAMKFNQHCNNNL